MNTFEQKLDRLSRQNGGKIPFGAMKKKDKTKKKRDSKKSKKPKRKSLTRQRRKSKERTASRSKKGGPIMSPKHMDDNVIHKGRDGNLYKVIHGKWAQIDLK